MTSALREASRFRSVQRVMRKNVRLICAESQKLRTEIPQDRPGNLGWKRVNCREKIKHQRYVV